MNYEPGSHIFDPDGNEWAITKTWEHKQYLCMTLIGTSGDVAGQMGGFRTEYEDGGALLVTRK